MAQKSTTTPQSVAGWHCNLLTVTAILTVLLIAMGGILCVTQSIRSCPDWPGCFGKIVPPLETSPILEFTHRLLAGSSGLLILAAAAAGLARARRLKWIVIPPLAASLLLVEVSVFGALVVLKGIPPGWAAVDVGSALLVVALMVTTAVIARARQSHPYLPDRLTFRSRFARLVLASIAVFYGVLVSGVLVAGPGSITGCLGWPIYSSRSYLSDGHEVGGTIRLLFSILGIFLIVAVLAQAWRSQRQQPAVFRAARRVFICFLVETLVQVLLLIFGFKVPLLAVYTVTAAAFWGLLVAMGVRVGLEADHRFR